MSTPFRFLPALVALVLSMGYGDVLLGQTPSVLQYHGQLRMDDRPANGTFSVHFALYPSSQGGSPIWSEVHEVTVADGVFDVLLGRDDPLADVLFDAPAELYLGVAVDSDPEMMPRLRMAGTAFAIRAGKSDSVAEGAVDAMALTDGAVTVRKLADHSVTTDKMADGAVTRPKLAEEAVSEGQLADGAVTSAKLGDRTVTTEKLAEGAVTEVTLADGAVTSEKLDDRSVTLEKLAENAAVLRINGIAGAVTLLEGENIEITQEGSTIRIATDPRVRLSSRRWKSEIQPIEDALSTVQRLRGVRFAWTESGLKDVGLIAEEVADVVPEVVAYEDGGEARSIDYDKLVAVLIEAIKAQQSQAEAQRVEVEDLLDRVRQLERRTLALP